MATIARFEDMEIWQQAREICKDVHTLCSKGAFAKDFELVRQISRSSGSCMDNVAEGFERDGNREFCQFLSIAKGSIGETRSQLVRALDRGYIHQAEFDLIVPKCLKASKDIGNFMRYLRNSDMKGSKFVRSAQ
jgi:four helix bundle protein